jgi:hypothetical protein
MIENNHFRNDAYSILDAFEMKVKNKKGKANNLNFVVFNELSNSTQLRIKVGRLKIESNSTRYDHEVSHIIASEYLKAFPKDIDKIKKQLPRNLRSSINFSNFSHLGEIIPEFIDEFYNNSYLNTNNQLEIHKDYLCSKSETWMDIILESKVIDFITAEKRSKNFEILRYSKDYFPNKK